MDSRVYRKTWIEVDLDAIHYNVAAVKGYLAGEKEIMAIVKANAYGHGAVQIAKEAISAGATCLGVALLEEAIQLRAAGIQVPILLMGYLAEDYFSVAHHHDVSITVTDREMFQRILLYAEGELQYEAPLKFHVKTDTGMNRLGLKTAEELVQLIDAYEAYQERRNAQQENHGSKILWEGLFTHFATADEIGSAYFEQQLDHFNALLELVDQRLDIPYIHIANSAAIFRTKLHPKTNLVRLGISMYGLYPSAEMKQVIPFDLMPALSLHSRLSLVKKLMPNEAVSYGATYQTDSEEWIGTVPIGYADGWRRELSNRGEVLINGQRMKIAGRICMDQLMVKLDQPYPKGTQVTLIGQQLGEEISADEVAQLLQTINYEITCMLTYRVPRIYVRNGKRKESEA